MIELFGTKMSKHAITSACFPLVVGIGLMCCLSKSVCAAGLEPFTIGTAPSLTGVLDYVADDQGFFQAEGLSVTIQQLPSGTALINNVLTGRLDAAAVTAIPVVATSFERKDFRIIATKATLANDNQVVARRSAGILKVSDLKGKRIGVPKANMPHYMLDLLLIKHGLSTKDIHITYGEPPQLSALLAANQIDAAALLGGFIAQTDQKLGTNAIIFSDTLLFQLSSYLLVHERLIEQRPGTIKKLLRGYLRAERFTAEHPEEAMAIAARKLKLNPAEVRKTWLTSNFRIGLHQSLLNDLEDKARWQMERGFTPVKHLPNYLNFFYFNALDEIAPEHVSIIH
jgi:NitT/TauT family transport system substrate-binding protein